MSRFYHFLRRARGFPKGLWRRAKRATQRIVTAFRYLRITKIILRFFGHSGAVEVDVFPPAEKCIYCGDTLRKRSEEHIVPLGLGGTHIIPKASCFIDSKRNGQEKIKTCSDVTSDIETQCLKPMLGPWRLLHAYPSYNPAGQPKYLQI